MKLTSLIEGLAIGALGMFFFDPNRGRARRAEFQDRTRSRMRRLRRDFTIMGRDFYNRARGTAYEVTHYTSRNNVSNEVLSERVRSSLGRCVTHPGSIMVEATDGHLILRGDILGAEVESAVRCAKKFAGSKKVQNELVVHGRHDGFPGLQGAGHVADTPDRWTPAMSLVMCVLGAGMTVRGLRRGDTWGGVLAAVGTGMIAKGFADTEHRYNASTRPQQARPRTRTTSVESEASESPLNLAPPSFGA
jgi:hypothetical protein